MCAEQSTTAASAEKREGSYRAGEKLYKHSVTKQREDGGEGHGRP